MSLPAWFQSYFCFCENCPIKTSALIRYGALGLEKKIIFPWSNDRLKISLQFLHKCQGVKITFKLIAKTIKSKFTVIMLPQNTVMHHLTMGTHCDRCIIRWFGCCVIMIECAYTNLEGTSITPCSLLMSSRDMDMYEAATSATGQAVLL